MESIHAELFSTLSNPGSLTEIEIAEYISKPGFSFPADYLEFIKSFHGGIEGPVGDNAYVSVSYTHLTLPTNREV